MDRAGIQKAFDDVFDQALVFHGFTDYMRDYEVLTYSVSDPVTGIPPSFERFLFRHCVEATVTTTVTPETWRVSLDERLLDHSAPADLDGFVWGVKWQCLYPGASLVQESSLTASWADRLGIPFYEAVIETNAHKVRLVFSDLKVTSVEPGYTPFVLSE